MPSRVLPLGQKPAEYFQHARLDLLQMLPQPLGRALDIGCGAGAVGAELLRQGAESVVGVEIDENAAAAARERGYETVLVMDAEKALDALTGGFDTILCYDILEHLYRPDTLLHAAAKVAREGATLSVSIPNARHVSLLFDLICRGTFGYSLSGHRDSTHVRWFTRRDLVALIEEAGWQVTRVDWPRDSRRYLPLLAAGRIGREFGAHTWRVQANK